MIHRQPSYYSSFRCLGGACPDTCCRDWDIVLDPETIADYQSAPPSLAQRLQSSLTIDEDGDTCFRLDEHGMCTMLTEDGLCAIQKEWGESHLCGHCAAYPRFIEEYGHLTEASLALSCPEVARLLLTAPAFEVEEKDDGHPDLPFPDIPPELMLGLEISRKKALDMMTQRRYTLWDRLQGILHMAHSLQNRIDAQEYSTMAGVDAVPCSSSPSDCKTFIQSLCRFFASLEPLRTSWPQRLVQCCQRLEVLSQEEYQVLCRDFEAQFPQWQQHLTNVAAYLLFRHWHKTVNDDQLYPRTAFFAASTVLLYHLFLVEWAQSHTLAQAQEITICCVFSREVEHMEENLELAMETCATLSPTSIPFPNS